MASILRTNFCHDLIPLDLGTSAVS
jgi:hypothetical protein